MTAEDLTRLIRNQNSHALSVQEHPPVALELINAGIGPSHEGLTEAEIEDLIRFDLDFNLSTTLGHLVDRNVVEVIQPNRSSPYVISERLDEIVNGRIDEVVEEDIELLIDQIQETDESSVEGGGKAVADGGGLSLTAFLADEFGVVADDLVMFLRAGEKVDNLNTAIDAIEESDEFDRQREYGRILFRFPARRYRISNLSMETYNT